MCVFREPDPQQLCGSPRPHAFPRFSKDLHRETPPVAAVGSQRPQGLQCLVQLGLTEQRRLWNLGQHSQNGDGLRVEWGAQKVVLIQAGRTCSQHAHLWLLATAGQWCSGLGSRGLQLPNGELGAQSGKQDGSPCLPIEERSIWKNSSTGILSCDGGAVCSEDGVECKETHSVLKMGLSVKRNILSWRQESV